MKHIKTFESYIGSLNEAAGMGPKLTAVWNKYKRSGIEPTLGDDLQYYYDNKELDSVERDAIDSLGKVKDLVDFNTFSGGRGSFDKFKKDLESAGLKVAEYFVDNGVPGLVVVNE
jgi:hypothetical protein